MIQPIVFDHVAQIFNRHYKLKPREAAEAARKFLEVLQLYDLQIVRGDWVRAPSQSKWERMMDGFDEAAEREPWLAREIQ